MTRLVPGLGLVAALVFLTVLGLRGCGPKPDPKVQEQRAADSAVVQDALTAAARSKHAADSMAQVLRDSAAAHAAAQQAAKDRANAKDRRIRQLLARDSARTDSLRQIAETASVPRPPALLAIDPTSSCEERYQLRTGEASDLRESLTECGRRHDADSAAAKVEADSAKAREGRLIFALNETNAARIREINRPRPCRRNLLLAHPSCNKVDGGVAVASFVLGLLVGRK